MTDIVERMRKEAATQRYFGFDGVANPLEKAVAALEQHEAEILSLRARVAELEAGLRPFAAFCEQAEHFVEDAAATGSTTILPTKHFRLSDFRRARALLPAPPPGGQ